MSNEISYATAEAFRKAVTDKAKSAATSSQSVNQLMRQFAYERFLTRIFKADDDQWILKGGIALLARLPDARFTRDIDLARTHTPADDIARELEKALDTDISDFFEFRLQPPTRTLGGTHSGVTIPVIAYLGVKEFVRFNVDIVTSVNMTDTPEDIEPRPSIDMPSLERSIWRAYPIVDHVADKFAAIVETHGADGRASSRYRDLVDIALIATTQRIDGKALRMAIISEFRFRRLELIFEITDVKAWEAGYTAIQSALPHLDLNFAVGCDIAQRVFEIIRHDRALTWDPKSLSWRLPGTHRSNRSIR